MNLKNKWLKTVGILNVLCFILIVVYENVIKFNYLYITDIPRAIILLFFSFLPFYLVFIKHIISERRKKKSGNPKKTNRIKTYSLRVLFICFLLFYLQIISFLYRDIMISYTTNPENYRVFDKGLDTPDVDLFIFPLTISENSSDVEYYYEYSTFDETYPNVAYDIYLKIVLPEDEYQAEKERIKGIADITDYKEINNGYFSNSSVEYIKFYNNRDIYRAKYGNEYIGSFYFVAFFDEERKIIYSMTETEYYPPNTYPHFIKINIDNIECTEDNICKIMLEK